MRGNPSGRCRLVEPDQRFSYEPVWKTGLQYDEPVYHCPSCNSTLQFSTENFIDHERHPRSNIDAATRAALDCLRPLKRLPSNQYSEENEHSLDFRCQCGLSVMLVYKLLWRSQGKADWLEECIVAVVESEKDDGTAAFDTIAT